MKRKSIEFLYQAIEKLMKDFDDLPTLNCGKSS